MKKLFFFAVYVIASTVLLSSCGLKECYIDGSDVTFVYKEKKGEKLYGVKYGQEISIPPLYENIGLGINKYTVFFSHSHSWDTFYLFEQNGTELLSGKRHDSKGFQPLAISTYEEVEDWERRYFGYIFCLGDYYLFNMESGKVCALFAYQSHYYSFGPYDKFFPGSTGFAYKQNGKWGATAFQTVEKQRLYTSIPKQEIFPAEYDEVIEVVRTKENSVWFARKGTNWSAAQIDKEGTVQKISVNKQLLNKVLRMPKREKAKGKKAGFSYDLAEQRVGTVEASIVFM